MFFDVNCLYTKCLCAVEQLSMALGEKENEVIVARRKQAGSLKVQSNVYRSHLSCNRNNVGSPETVDRMQEVSSIGII